MTIARVPPEARLHWPCLAVAVAIMVIGTVYPPLMTGAAGQPLHGLSMALFWAMSTGYVRGVGFLPQRPIWRALFSGWSCGAALLLAAALALSH